MNNINFMHINAKEFSWIYGQMLDNYQLLKKSKFVNFGTFLNCIASEKNRDSFIEVAYQNNRIIGFISYGLNEHFKTLNINKCEITLLVVLPDYRNQSIGSMLLENAFSYMLERQINDCTFFCSKDFDPDGYNFWLNKGAIPIQSTYENNVKIDLFNILDISSIIQKQKM